MLTDIKQQLGTLYSVYDAGTCLGIRTYIYLDGEPVNFLFYQEDSKYARLVTGPNFSQWMACCTGDWKKAAPTIEKLAAFYGAAWDTELGALVLRFRRNEMTVAQAVLRMQQAVAVICALD